MRQHYSEEFKDQALTKVLQRGDKTIQCIANELNINTHTLKTWLKRKRQTTPTETMPPRSPNDWTREQRFEALLASAGLEAEALHAFCRERGLFSHHLEAWKQDFIKSEDPPTEGGSKRPIKAIQAELKQVKKELQRKEKALAEAAALLVLQKKCQAFWEEKE